MDNSAFTLKQLDEDTLNKDPFSRARSMADSKAQAQANPVSMDSPFPNFSIPEAGAPQSTGGDMQAKLYPQMNQEALLQAMSQMGLDSSKISFTPVGRINMQNQLQSKYGTDYMNNKELGHIITSFDNILSKNPLTASANKNKQEANAKRILGFLGRP